MQKINHFICNSIQKFDVLYLILPLGKSLLTVGVPWFLYLLSKITVKVVLYWINRVGSSPIVSLPAVAAVLSPASMIASDVIIKIWWKAMEREEKKSSRVEDIKRVEHIKF